MVEQIETAALQRLLSDSRTQVLDVLASVEYRRWHIPGARSVPLEQMRETAIDGLDRAAPVVVYCFDWP